MDNGVVASDPGSSPTGRASYAVSPVPASIPNAADLLATIRLSVGKWAKVYERQFGHEIQPGYAAGLANDIAFELGILEAAEAGK